MNYIFWCVFFMFGTSMYASSFQNIETYFDLEGNNPQKEDYLEFSALKSKHMTPNGHGFRNELKKKAHLRRDMYKTKEKISAEVEFHLSSGSKTIFLQYHCNDTKTLVLLMISDVKNKKLHNGIPLDNIFDIFAILSLPNGKKETISFASLPNNSKFNFSLHNDFGNVTIKVNDKEITRKVDDSPKAYLKFGDYLQAKDPFTNEQIPQNQMENFYTKNNIVEDKIIFQNLHYEDFIV